MLCRARHASCLLAGMKNRPEDIPLFCLTLPSFPPDRGKDSVRGYPPFRGRTQLRGARGQGSACVEAVSVERCLGID